MPSPVRPHSGRLNALKRYRSPDDPAVLEAADNLAAASAHRAVDDPATLARAVRIVRAALDRQQISVEDLTPLPAPAPLGERVG